MRKRFTADIGNEDERKNALQRNSRWRIENTQKLRLWYPPNDKPVFSYPVISMRAYEWSRKSLDEKIWFQFLSGLWFVGWIYFCFVASARRFIGLEEFGLIVWKLLKGLLVFAIFPAIFIVAALARKNSSTYKWEHVFYDQWARVYTRESAKGGGQVRFFFEDIASLRFHEAVYKDTPFYLVAITFKPSLNFLGEGRELQIGILTDREGLQPLVGWAERHKIRVDFADPGTQRRS